MMRRCSKAFWLILIVFSSCLMADTHNWVAGSGNWSNPANWSPAQVPAVGDDVIIDTPTSYTVTLDVDADIVNLTLGVPPGPGTFQTLQISGNTLTINGTANLTETARLIMSAGVINGPGSLDIEGEMTWTGGSMRDGGTTTISADGSVVMDGSAAKSLQSGRAMINDGDITLQGTGDWDFQGGATFENNGTFSFASDANIDLTDAGTSTLTNNGTVQKTGGTGISLQDLPINGSGSISVGSGTLSFEAGGADASSASVAFSSVLEFGGGTMDLTTCSISGAGTVLFSGGTALIGGFFAATTTEISGGTADFTFNPVLGTPPPNPLLQNLNISGGALTGNRTIQVEAFSWSGGEMTGTGTTILESTGTLSISGSAAKALRGSRTLNTMGPTNIDGAGDVDFDDDALWTNSDTVTFLNSATLDRVNTSNGLFRNSGILRRNVPPLNLGTLINDIDITLENEPGGTIDVQNGGIRLNHDSDLAGNIQGSGELILHLGDHNFSATVLAGNVRVTNGVVAIAAGGATVDNDSTFAQSAGTLSGSGILAVNGQFNWSGGEWDGAGGVTVGGSASLNLSGILTKTMRNGWVLSNLGTVNVAGFGTWSMAEGAAVNNQSGAFFDFLEDTNINDLNSTVAPVFTNMGTLRKTGGTGTSELEMVFNSTSSVEADSGFLSFELGGTSSGNILLSSMGGVGFDGGDHTLTGSISGSGEFLVSGGTVNVNGPYSVGNTNLVGGVMNLAGTPFGPSSATTVDLNITFGELNGGGNLDVQSSFNWTGGDLEGAGTTNIALGANMSISGNSVKELRTGHTLRLSGNGTWTGSGDIDIFDGASIVIENGATLEMRTDANLDHISGGADTTLLVNGTLRKATTPLDSGEVIGISSSNIESNITNSGTIEVQFGEIIVIGDNTYTGLVDVSSGAAYEMNGGVHTWTGGTMSGAGIVQVHNGTMTIPAGVVVTVPVGSIFQQLAGTLNGNGDLNVNGTYDWSGGTVSGVGSILINSGASMTPNGTNTKILRDDRILTNSGTITWTGTGDIDMVNGAVFDNIAPGVFDMQSDARIDHVSGGTAPVITNQGTFRKSGGTGTSIIEPTFNNNDTLDLNTGTLALSGGGSSSGDFNLAAGTVLSFTSGTHILGPDSSVSGAGAASVSSTADVTSTGGFNPEILNISGGTLTIDNTSTITSLNMSLGTLSGNGGVTASGASTWSGGEMNGNGGFTIAASGSMAISGNSAKRLHDGRVFINNGTVTWTGLGEIGLDNGASFNNAGGATFDIQTDAVVDLDASTPAPTFLNAGSMLKTLGSPASLGGSTIFDVAVTNTGTIDVQTGTIDFRGGGVNSGIIEVAVGSTVDFSNVTNFTHNSSSNVTGAGTFLITGATAVVQGSFDLDNVNLTSGTLTLDPLSPISLTSFQQLNGSLDGGGTFTALSTFDWRGGTQEGSGSTIIPAGVIGVLSTTTQKILTGSRVLDNSGTLNWQDNGSFNLGQSASVENRVGATFDIQGDGNMNEVCCLGVTAIINNAGELVKSANTGVTTLNIPVANSGVIRVNSGELRFNDPITGAGALEINAPGVLRLASETHNFAAGSSVSGNGLLLLSGATVDFAGNFAPDNLEITSGTLNLTGPAPAVENLTMGFGTLTGDLTINSSAAWTGGVWAGPGTTTIANGATLEVNSSSIKTMESGRVLDNLGLVNWLGAGSWRMNDASTITNRTEATFDCQADATLDHVSGADAAFDNQGLFSKSAGTGTSTIDVMVNNTNTLRAGSGTMRFTFGLSNDAAIEIGALGKMTIQSAVANLNAAGSVTGTGTFEMLFGSTVNQDGSFVFEGLTRINNGTMVADADVTTAHFELEGGLLGGTANLTAAQSFTWTSGQMGSSGVTTLASSAAGVISGTTSKDMIDSRVFENEGTLAFSGTGHLRMGGTAAINNSGTFIIQNDEPIENLCCANTASFNNSGLLRRLATAPPVVGTSNQMDVNFTNNGLVEIEDGTMDFLEGFTQNDGLFRLNGGQVTTVNTFALNGGTLAGVGTFTGSVDNQGGVVLPGVNGPGILSINGDYTQGSIGFMVADINGTTPGTEYSQLLVSGTATLDGTFEADVDAKFLPSQGDQFEVLNFTANSGEFSSYAGTVLPGGLELSPTFETSRFLLDTTPQTVVSWANPVSGLWSDGSNWVGGVAPGPTDHAHITVAGSYVVTLDQNVEVLSVTLGGDSGGDQELVISGNILEMVSLSRVLPGGVLVLSGGSIQSGFVPAGEALGVPGLEVSGFFSVRGSCTVGVPFSLLDGGITQVLGTVDTGPGSGNATLTSEGSTTIAGQFFLDSNGAASDATLAVPNDGVIITATGQFVALPGDGGARAVTLSPSGDLSNQGSVAVLTDLAVTPVNSFLNSGLLELDNAASLNLGAALQNDGALKGIGTIVGNVINNDLIEPGFPVELAGKRFAAGLLSIDGDLTLGSDGTVAFELDGLDPGVSYDRLNVSGAVTFNGLVLVNFPNSFDPPSGSRFDIMNYASFSGTASLDLENPGNGVVLQSDFTTSTLALDTVEAGPFNGIQTFVADQASDVLFALNSNNADLNTFIEVGEAPQAPAGNAAGTVLYVSNRDSNSLSVVDAVNGRVTATVSGLLNPGFAAVTNDDAEVWIAASFGESTLGTSRIDVIDTSDNTLGSPIQDACISNPVVIVFHPFLELAYVINGAGTLCEIDVSTKTVNRSTTIAGSALDAVITPDGAFLYVTSPATAAVIKVDTNDLSFAPINLGGAPAHLDIDAGDNVYVAKRDSQVSVIATLDDSVTTIFVPFASALEGISVVPEEDRGFVTDPVGSLVASFSLTQGDALVTAVDAVDDRLLPPLQLPVGVSSNRPRGDVPPQVFFAAPSFQVEENVSQVEILVDLSFASDAEVRIDIATGNTGDATPGSDYVPITLETLTFAPGETQVKTTVEILDDRDQEDNETVQLLLSNPVGAVLTDPSDVFLNILDVEEGVIQFDMVDYTVSESGGEVTLEVTRTNGTDGPVTVQLATADVTATAGEDYQSTVAPVIFANGNDDPVFIAVPVRADAVNEGNETFSVGLSNPTGNAVLGTQNPATVTILDGGSVAFSSSAYVAGETDGLVNIELQRVGSSTEPVTVRFQTVDNTANAGDDYVAVDTEITMAAGETLANAQVEILQDNQEEGSENLGLGLRDPATDAVLNTAELSIADDDDAGFIQFTAADFVVNEDVGSAQVQLERLSGTDGDLSIVFQTISGGTADPVDDYTVVETTVTFEDGQNLATVPVPIINDTDAEDSETIFLQLSQGEGLGPQTVSRITILDDDSAQSVSFLLDVYEVDEDAGQALIEVVRTGSTDETQVVIFNTELGGDAEPGLDYEVVQNRLLTFEAGQSSVTTTVTINADLISEPQESVNLSLSQPAKLGFLDTAQLLINNVDVAVVTFSNNQYSVSELGGSASIQLNRSGSLEGELSVIFRTGQGTAQAGEDYEAVDTTVTFANGQSTLVQTVIINDDVVVEGNEFVTLDLEQDLSPTLGGGVNATLIIRDAEAVFNPDSYQVTEGSETSVEVTVTRVGDGDLPMNLLIDALDNTATEGEDYTFDPVSFTLSEPDQSQSFTINIVNDEVEEPNEIVNLLLMLGERTQSQGSLGILDDDSATAQIRFESATQAVDENVGEVSFTVGRLGNSSGTINVGINAVAAQGPEAEEGVDFRLDTTQLIFEPGVESLTGLLTIRNDNVSERSETFALELSVGQGAVLTDPSTKTYLIRDNDTSTVSWEGGTVTVDEGDASITLTARATRPFDRTVSVPLSISGDAENGTDYTLSRSSLVFSSGSQVATVQVGFPENDRDDEAEGRRLILGISDRAGDNRVKQINIRDNDEPINEETPVVNWAQTQTVAGEGSVVTLRAVLDQPSQIRREVEFNPADASTASAQDASPVSGVLVFEAGVVETSLILSITDDDEVEPAETLGLVLSGGNLEPGANSTTGIRIIDNDEATVSWVETTITVEEDDTRKRSVSVTLSARLSRTVAIDVSVPYAVGGTATAGEDHNLANGSFSFPAGTTIASVNFLVFGDTVEEATEGIAVALLGDIPIAGSTRAAVIILDNDADQAPDTQILSPAVGSVRKIGQEVVFTAEGTDPQGEDVRLFWEICLTTGSCIEREGASFTMSFAEDGLYRAACYAVDASGNEDRSPARTAFEIVANVPPEVRIVEPASSFLAVSVGETISFRAEAIDPDEEVGAKAPAISWSVLSEPDVQVAGDSFERTFDQAGTFTVIVTATDAEGAEAADFVNIRAIEDEAAPTGVEVVEPADRSRFNVDVPIDFKADLLTLPATKAALARAKADKREFVFRWQLGDGRELAGQSLEGISYSRPGRYQVRFTAADPAANIYLEDTISLFIRGGNAPVVDFNFPRDLNIQPAATAKRLEAGEVYYRAIVTQSNGYDESELNFFWDMGDGRTFRQPAPGRLVYENEGTFTVSLYAVSPDGLQSETVYRTIRVAATADSDFEPNEGFDEAADLKPGSYENLSLDDASAEDFFTIQVTRQGQRLSVKADLDGEATLEIYDQDRNLIQSREVTIQGNLQLRGLNPGTYFLRLTASGEAKRMGLSYGLAIEVLNPALFFADIQVNEKRDTSLGVVNPTNGEASIDATAFDHEGNVVGTAQLTLPALGRCHETVEGLFGDVADIAWVQVDATSDLVGYARTESRDFTEMYAVTASKQLSSELHVPHIAEIVTQWETRASVVNGSDLPAGAQLVSPTKTIDLELDRGFSSDAFDFLNRFDGELPDGTAWATFTEVDSNNNLAGVEVFGTIDGTRVTAGLELANIRRNNPNFTYVGKNLYFTHVARDVTNFYTGVALVNISNFEQTVRLRTYGEDGVEIGTKLITLTPNQKLVEVAQTFLDGAGSPANVDWFLVESDVDIIGFELFGTFDGRRMAGLEASTALQTELCYPFIDPDPNVVHGISVVNAHASEQPVTFTVYNDAGDVIGTVVETLKANQKRTRTIESLLEEVGGTSGTPGWLSITAANPLAGFELFLNESDEREQMGAITAQ